MIKTMKETKKIHFVKIEKYKDKSFLGTRLRIMTSNGIFKFKGIPVKGNVIKAAQELCKNNDLLFYIDENNEKILINKVPDLSNSMDL